MATLYEDEHFPASLASMFYDGRPDPGIEWKRPKEINEAAVFFNEGATKYDIAQGMLSDCWFLSAVAVLATRRELFSEIVPEGQGFGENYTGQFHFRFWRYGRWEDVEIDDRLPTKDGLLYFCHNRETPNEFWSALIEKAYAKVHRSYQALDLGYSQDALVDLTGGIGEFIDLNGAIGIKVAENDDIKTSNITKLFKRLKRLVKKECSFLCAAIDVKEGGEFEDTQNNGLVTGHAYSLCTIREEAIEERMVRLIKLRNPWGYKEWTGPWADGSAEWAQLNDEQKAEIRQSTTDEGEFWMTFEDWAANFDVLNLCHLTPDSVHGPYGTSLWESADFSGIWTPGATAGGCSKYTASYWQNPQYFVKLVDPDEDEDNKCTMVVSLMQKYTRVKKTTEKLDETEAAIGFDIYKYRGEEPEELDGLVASEAALQMKCPMYDFKFFRERTRRFELSPGTYCVVPCTYEPDTEGQYLLRLAFEKPAESGEVDTPSGHIAPVNSGAGRKFDRLFTKHAGDDDVIDAKELRKILNEGLKREQDEAFSKETCRALVKSVVGNRRGTLAKDSCKQIWRQVKAFQGSFDDFDQNASGSLNIRELRKCLKAAGYTLSKQALTGIAQQYCGKSSNLSLDDYVFIATKIATTTDAFEEVRSRTRGDRRVALTLDEVLKMAI